MITGSPGRRLLLFLPLTVLVACQTISASEDVPAVIADPTEVSRADLRATLMEIFGERRITVAEDALTSTSLLVLEQGPQRTGGPEDVSGRQMLPPLRLRLVKNGDDCVLVDLRDDSRHLLADTNCRPE